MYLFRYWMNGTLYHHAYHVFHATEKSYHNDIVFVNLPLPCPSMLGCVSFK